MTAAGGHRNITVQIRHCERAQRGNPAAVDFFLTKPIDFRVANC
jgi:hypothetical protein